MWITEKKYEDESVNPTKKSSDANLCTSANVKEKNEDESADTEKQDEYISVNTSDSTKTIWGCKCQSWIAICGWKFQQRKPW